jgi:hypothetical protein
MTEILIVLGLFVALVWAVVRAILIILRTDSQSDGPAVHADPISTYVDENYGSHFVEDPVTVNRDLRRI